MNGRRDRGLEGGLHSKLIVRVVVGMVSHPLDMVRTLEVVMGLSHCYLGGGTIPKDQPIGIQGGLVLGGGTPGFCPEAHHYGWRGDDCIL